MREVLTAIESSMGSSGGITEVMIREQFNNSLYLLLVGSSRPYINQKKISSMASTSQNTTQCYAGNIVHYTLLNGTSWTPKLCILLS